MRRPLSSRYPAFLLALLPLSLLPLSLLLGCDEAQPAQVAEPRAPIEGTVERTVDEARERVGGAGEFIKKAAASAVLPPEREEALGDRMAAEIASRSKLREDGPIVAYVRDLGARVVAAADENDERDEAIDFDFHVIEEPEINAFALPGGHIYVTTGLLRAAGSEAEVVAVLGHEVAHVTRRHIAERMEAVYGVSTLTSIALGEESSLLGQIAARLLARGFLLKHSRDDEREADTYGMAYVIDAGHSPVGFATFFDRISEQPRPPVWLSTHPEPEARAAKAREAMDQLDPSIVERPVHRERYRKLILGQLFAR